ncbi:MAG: hypothetical protein HY268_18865 [Deltaproteobacteria bacterium]|nr:hypothetical protein [Deltaproteobacteria bacterium]
MYPTCARKTSTRAPWYSIALLARIFSVPLLFLALAAPLWAQTGQLEDPTPDAVSSGIGLIRGWVCQATLIEIQLDEGSRLRAAYGTTRGDTQGVCGDSDNGFGLTVNWNLLGPGTHRVRAFADGKLFADMTFTVATLGSEFLTGRSGSCTVPNFPQAGKSVELLWQESIQNFVITGGNGGGGGSPGDARQKLLEDPAPGSRQSGIGLIRGWVCQTAQLEVQIDDGPRLHAAYGTTRGDTQGVCGDANNGFGLTINWNLVGNGLHRVRAFADGVQFADVTFTVTTLGSEFLMGRSGGCLIPNFPQAGTSVTVAWQESLQNFVIVGTCPTTDQFCQGAATLALGDFHEAAQRFSQAAAANQSDDHANLALALSHLVVKALDDPQIASLVSRSGGSVEGDSHNVCTVHRQFPQTVPAGAPGTEEIFDTLRSVLAPELDAALTNLSRISSGVSLAFDPRQLPACLRPRTSRLAIEIDHGDVLAFTALLQGLRAVFDLGAGYHVDMPLGLALHGTGQQILAAAPSLLALRSGGALGTARGFASPALTNLSAAITAIQAEADDQSDDLLVITPGDSATAQRTKQILDLLRQSLQGQVTFPTSVGLPAPERLNLSPLFSAQFTTLRPLLPELDGAGNFDLHHFPDPTFAGMAPDVTQDDIDNALETLTAFFWSLF